MHGAITGRTYISSMKFIETYSTSKQVGHSNSEASIFSYEKMDCHAAMHAARSQPRISTGVYQDGVQGQ